MDAETDAAFNQASASECASLLHDLMIRKCFEPHRRMLLAIPPATRMVLKELRTGLILGWYVGWLPPSPHSALLTILCAVKSKVEEYARFGITITEGQMPSGMPKGFLADHGELKGSAIDEAADQFGFSVEYPPTFRGDRKGGVESQHHTDHKKVDDELPGYNHAGRHRDRGEDHAALSANWNFPEYMRELLLHWLWYNTEEEVPEVAPFDMLAAVPAIRPTRVNIFNWLREHDNTSEIAVAAEELEAFCLPDYPAVIRKNAVYLKLPVGGREMILPRLAYSSAALVASGLLQQVKQTGKSIQTRIKLNPEALLPARGVPYDTFGLKELEEKLVAAQALEARAEGLKAKYEAAYAEDDERRNHLREDHRAAFNTRLAAGLQAKGDASR